jgi:peptide deformylase
MSGLRPGRNVTAGLYNHRQMSILKVARMGHPVLRAKALPVPEDRIRSAPIQRLIDDMFETMREYSGIGLAGPQVHERLRIFVAGVREGDVGDSIKDDDGMPYVALINPEVTLVGAATHEGWEGCLSIPDIRGLVPRAHDVRVQAFDRTGKKIAFAASGLPARVIQHENDHLDGVLFFDRMRSLESLAFMEEYRRYCTDPDEEGRS